MNALPAAWLPALLAGVVAVSPLLASWTVILENATRWRWWQPRHVTPSRWVSVAAVAVGLTIAGSAAGGPWLAWTAFAVGGAVLMKVDVCTHLLPARFVYPLGGVIGAVLISAAILTGTASSLLRSVLAGVAVGAVWLLVAFVAPSALGLGDVRLFAISAALLGWLSWPAVLAGQCLTFLLAPGVAVCLLAVGRSTGTRVINVSMGPPSVVATVVVGWLMHT